MSLRDLPELKSLHGVGADSGSSLIRIPSQIDVPVTDRILRLIDTPQFQRLNQISQLGLVRYVYPAAHHTRFEHSLGVYRNSLLFLQHFANNPRFVSLVTPKDATRLVVAALFHDIGHWPFCHPIEDLRLEGIPEHESVAREYIFESEIATLLSTDWDLTPEDILSVIEKKPATVSDQLLGSILSGPIDIDKMDYLYRDSLHAGVPYGLNFDTPRLIRSLCMNLRQDRLAITRKGKTAAELMVFARYIMFSEVYWHHAVRSATAMFQRAFYHWHQQRVQESGFPETCRKLFGSSEHKMVEVLVNESKSESALQCPLLSGLFGSQRNLYKMVSSYSLDHNQPVYSQIAQKPYSWIAECSEHLSRGIAQAIQSTVGGNEVLIDAPPVGLEVQFDVDVFFGPENGYQRLGDVSPVVKTLATRQFDDFVKQVRIFVAPHLRDSIAHHVGPAQIDQLLLDACEQTGQPS